MMWGKNLILVILLFLQLNEISAQVRLLDEKLSENIYTLTFKVDPFKYEVRSTATIKQIYFNEFVDESKPGLLSIPKNEIFIAIPPDRDPALTFEITGKEYLDAVPLLNPKVTIDHEGKFSNKDIQVWDGKIEKDFINKGIVQLGNNRCIHITASLLSYDLERHKFFFIKKFTVALKFSSVIMPSSQKEGDESKVTHIIINKKFASQFLSSSNSLRKVSDDSWIDYQRDYIKLGLANDGIYRIKNDDLTRLGINTSSIDPKTFQMFWKGKEIPIYVYGQEDNRFDTNDYIDFVGTKNYNSNYREINSYNTPYNEYLNRYSDTTVVFLSWGKQNGKRIPLHQIPAGSSSKTIDYYNRLNHYEQNIWFDFSTDQLVRRQMPYWIENETWLWRNQGVGALNLDFNVSNLVFNKQAKAFVKLQSYASDIIKNSHKVGLTINNEGIVYDSIYFDSFKQRVIQASFNSSLLANGGNKVKCISFPTKSSINSVFHDWYEIEYPCSLIFENDSLQFQFKDYRTPEVVNYKLSGYKGSSLALYKYGSPSDVERITNYVAKSDTIIFSDMIDSTKKYFAIADSKVLLPKFYYKKKFINLRNSENTADYIIITNSLLMNSANEYANFISQNYNKVVRVIDVNDIYDEFNYGFFAPEPIKEFLQTAYYNWSSPRPEYVLLLGSANYDYYLNRQKQLPAPPHPDLVPSYGVPVSDNWFVDWDSTSIFNPLLKIGRVPARTETDARNYLNKHKNYLSQAFSEVNKRFLFFSGGLGNNQQELDNLRNGNKIVIDNFVKPAPIGGITNHFYKTLTPNTNFGPYSVTKVQNTIDSSAVFISYLGHSGTQTWDNSITDVRQLRNIVNANPLITDFGCSTAKFAEPDITSFSELFTISNDGQAICYIGNTSLGFAASSLVAPKLFYETVLKDSVLNISDALNKAKAKLLTQYGASDVNKLFVLTNSLIGNPIVSLKIAPKPNLKISQNDITFFPNKITSRDDSAKCTIRYFNLGRVIDAKFSISIKDDYNGATIIDKKIGKTIPLFKDSIIVSVPVKDKPGKHKISVELDAENNLIELSENDNRAQNSLFVTSSSIRALSPYDIANSFNVLKLLNPIAKGAGNSIDYQISADPTFANPVTSKIQMGELFTQLSFGTLQKDKRYWLRIKTSERADYDITKSFFNSSVQGYLLNDSVSFNTGMMVNTVANTTIHLGKETMTFEAISAGFNDGNTGVITKNNQNYVPFPNRGHNVCVFDGTDYSLKSFNQFDLLFGSNQAQDNYLKLLDTLKTSDILVIVVVDEGSINLNSSIKQRLRDMGSKYVDSLSFRDSWAFIVRKGTTASAGSESYTKMFSGRAIAKYSFEKNYSEGSFETSFIGTAKEWNHFDISFTKPAGTNLSYILLGKSASGRVDTLRNKELAENTINLTDPTFMNYPYMQMLLRFRASANGESPEVKSFLTNYKGVAELGTNYQVVSLSKDTLTQGETENLSFYVYNVGESRADSFKVRVEIVKPDNLREKIFEEIVDSLGVDKKKLFNASYNTTSAGGNRNFQITIDPDGKILELYKDNNLYSVSFYVKTNTAPASIQLAFDGNDIINGDYISPNPDIKIELNDLSQIPIADTSHVQLYLNNKRISLDSKLINYSFSNNNPKFVVNYKPTLSDGTYTLKVVGTNATGQLIDSVGTIRKFMVTNQAQLLYVYNYPNPFSGETFFTFKLTQIPDELKIKIFTVNGRLIKEVNVPPSNLNYDFNRIEWDGRDEDGDLAANGVYLYKVIMKKGSETVQAIQKLAIVR